MITTLKIKRDALIAIEVIFAFFSKKNSKFFIVDENDLFSNVPTYYYLTIESNEFSSSSFFLLRFFLSELLVIHLSQNQFLRRNFSLAS